MSKVKNIKRIVDSSGIISLSLRGAVVNPSTTTPQKQFNSSSEKFKASKDKRTGKKDELGIS